MRLKRRRIDFPGGPAGVLELGDGAGRLPVALVHGFAGDLLTWQFTLPHLSANRRVLALDLPGHGGSTQDVGDGSLEGLAGWLGRALDALEVERAHLVGHSMGGALAVLLALAAPERAASLSLLACAGLSPVFDRDLLLRMLDARTPEAAEACVAALFAGPSPLTEPMAKALLARVNGPVPVGPLRRILEAGFGRERPEPLDWSRIKVPIRFVWGDADRVVPPPGPEWLAPDAPLHMLDGVGHLPHLEAASRVNAILAEALAGLE